MRLSTVFLGGLALAGCPAVPTRVCTSPTAPEYDLANAKSCGEVQNSNADQNQRTAAENCMTAASDDRTSSYYWESGYGIEGGAYSNLLLYDFSTRRKIWLITAGENRQTVSQVQVCHWLNSPQDEDQECQMQTGSCTTN